MKDKRKINKKIILLAIIFIISVQMIGITYAKYITSEKAIGEAEIAKWSFEIVKEGEQTKNVKLTNLVDKETLVNGKIAPGTSGEIIIDIDGSGSEVDMDYSVNFINEKNKPNNIVFTYGVSKAKSLSEFDNIQGHIAHDEPQTRRILIEWVWEYETGKESEEITANDIIDTQDGITLDEYTFDIVVTAAQSN